LGQLAPSSSEHRLDSWKEIAAFFGRDERTVRRWEKENALPVHRVPGSAKGRVFAFESELRQWLSTPQAMDGPSAVLEPQVEEAQLVRERNLHAAAKWVVVVAACAILVGGVFAYRKRHRFAVNASEARAPRTTAQPVHSLDTAEAEDLYLKGRYFWNKRTPEDLNKALDLFTQAIVRDPAYAQAYVGLADCYNLMREYSVMPPSEAYPRALAAAKKAVELDDNSAEAHNSLAFATFYWTWDAPTAEHEFKRAIELNPDYVAAHHWYATFLMATRRYPEAIREIEIARKLDPSSTPIVADKGFILYLAGQQAPGIALLKQIETREPAFLSPHLYLAEIYLAGRDHSNYLVESKKVASLRHDPVALAVVSAAEKGFTAGGTRGMWQSMLQVQKKFYLQGKLSAYALAQTYSQLGEGQEAIKRLHEAYDKRDAAMLYLDGDRVFDALRDDPSFQDLLARSSQPRPD
jgi:tetratricopeptide (TPR) repeat protein